MITLKITENVVTLANITTLEVAIVERKTNITNSMISMSMIAKNASNGKSLMI